MFLANRLRWLRRSSTLRLSLLLSVVFAIGMAVSVVAVLDFGRDAVLRRVDLTLQGLASAVEADETPDDPFAAIIRPVWDLNPLPPEFARVAARGGGTVNLEQNYRRSDSWRALVARDSEGVPILIAVPLDDTEDTLEVLSGILLTTAMVVVALTLAIGLGVGLLAQRRLLRISGTLDALGRGELQARTGATGSSDDLDDLAHKLDVTAAELERLVTQTRNLSANLAHDLRTPLARLRARLEALPEGEARGAALEEAARLSGIFDTIMRVARIEAAQGNSGFSPVDLSELAEEIAEIFGPVVEDADRQLHLSLSPGPVVQADRQMLVQALANLIQNALVHGAGDITLFVGALEIGVADQGPGVDPGSYDEILRPMVRLDAARATEGSGLGLALVRAVADRHGARVGMSANSPTGLRVSLKFAEL